MEKIQPLQSSDTETKRNNGQGGYMASSTGSSLSNKQVGLLLNWWADQVLRYNNSSQLGYPSQTNEAKLSVYMGRIDARPPGSIVPDLPMSLDFMAIDRVMRSLEGDAREVAFWHFLGPGNTGDKVRAFCERSERVTTRAYYHILDRVYEGVRVGLALAKQTAN